MRKESRRNAEVRDGDKRMEDEIEADIPEAVRLKAHLKRRVERQTKNKWVQYATEYASEIVTSSTREKEAIRQYLDMAKEAVMDMDKKEKAKRSRRKERKTRDKHTF